MESKKPVCKYGAACYRKNPEHFKQYSHPGDVESKNEPPNSDKEKKVHSKRKQQGQTKVTGAGPSITSYFTKKTTATQDTVTPGEDNSSGIECSVGGDANSSGSPPAKRKRMEEPVEENRHAQDKDKEEEKRSRESYVDSDELLKESSNDRENIRRKFLVDMPEDFYHFWDFCKSLNPAYPQDALKGTLELELTGPYDVLAGNLKGVPWNKCVLHSRHYYDPPELVTVLSQHDETGYHIGYFRDDPKRSECLLVSNCSRENCELKIEGDSIFSVIRNLISRKLSEKSLSSDCKQQLESLDAQLASKMTHSKGLSIRDLNKQRQKLTLTKCFHKMGLVVPYDKKTELGYRPLPMSDRDLWRLLNKIASCSDDEAKRDMAFEPLQEVITLVQFANDECDYGMGLELGLNLFSHGNQSFHTNIEQLLPLAYDLLQREEYSKVCQEHLKTRTEEPSDFRV